MTYTKKYASAILVSMIFLSAARLHAIRPDDKAVYTHLSAGLAYPQIPLSQFRPPIGATGSLGLHYRVHDPWWIHASANGLKTFSLGTITNEKAELKFDALWLSLDAYHTLSRDFHRIHLISAGMGWYKLNRQLDRDVDNVKTAGINLAFVRQSFRGKLGSVFEIRWHLLFQPDDNPQILTVTFGILI